jgi:hypothetical protein
MKDLEHARTAESKDSRPAYEPPAVVIIGPLQEITLGALSQNGDTGGNPGFRNKKD